MWWKLELAPWLNGIHGHCLGVGPSGGSDVAERDLDVLLGTGSAPDADREIALHDHVVLEQRRQVQLRLRVQGRGGERDGRAEDSEGANHASFFADASTPGNRAADLYGIPCSVS